MTGHQGDVWTLHRRNDGWLLAELNVTSADFPWLYARVVPRRTPDGETVWRPVAAATP